MAYQPLYISKYSTGLVQNRPNFILPEDAYPIFINMVCFREKIKRRQGLQKIGRLRRTFDLESISNTGASPWNFNIFTELSLPKTTTEPNAQIEPGSVIIEITPTTATGAITNVQTGTVTTITSVGHGLTTGQEVYIDSVQGTLELNGGPYSIVVASPNIFLVGENSNAWGKYTTGGNWTRVTGSAATFTDNGDGTLAGSAGPNTIDYETGEVDIVHSAGAGAPVSLTVNYFPGLPVTGVRTRELPTINTEMTVYFDTTYAYILQGDGFKEFISGTTWTGEDYNLFWSTNYWFDSLNNKLMWVTNFSGPTGDPIRYTNGVTWTNYAPLINATDSLQQCLSLLPFRGRLLAFNTWEGATLAGSVQQRQRIRWSAIGTPLDADAWRADLVGKGGFLEIPTAENITGVGFVRDNLVVFCERSTWQLRYTGRSIQPFQIEKVNTEIGVESPFSIIQFDASIMGIGDKGVLDCDSFQSKKIDVKIPDLVFTFNNVQNGFKRVTGYRDIQQRLVYWAYPDALIQNEDRTNWPNRRLVYNYENDSWAIFTDSITSMGTQQEADNRTWDNSDFTWEEANFSWDSGNQLFPTVVGGNQQGYIFRLSNFRSPLVSNQQTLFISDITGNTTTPTLIECNEHNLNEGQIIEISNVVGDFSSLNDQRFYVQLDSTDPFNKFLLWSYNSNTGQFNTPRLDAAGTYIGGGEISLRDNFSMVSKKFNFLDKGENIQLGYMDILLDTTQSGSITLNTYLNYNSDAPINTYPQNVDTRNNLSQPDAFFNIEIPTTQNSLSGLQSDKNFQRVYCPTRGSFITLELTLNNEQMAGNEQSQDVQIDSQVLWVRPAGRLSMF